MLRFHIIALLIISSLFGQQLVFASAAMVKQRQQMEQQAVMRKKAMQMKAMKEQQVIQQAQMQQGMNDYAVDESEVVEVVDITDIWETFKTSSEAWPLIIDQKAKVLTVTKYIHDYQIIGVAIQKPPEYYGNLIDSMLKENESLLSRPFDEVLKIIAIIEYDFNNGQDKDSMALKILGQKAFIANKQRLGIK